MSETQETPEQEAPAPPPTALEQARAYAAVCEKSIESAIADHGIESLDPAIFLDLANVHANVAQASALTAIAALLRHAIVGSAGPASALFVPGR